MLATADIETLSTLRLCRIGKVCRTTWVNGRVRVVVSLVWSQTRLCSAMLVMTQGFAVVVVVNVLRRRQWVRWVHEEDDRSMTSWRCLHMQTEPTEETESARTPNTEICETRSQTIGKSARKSVDVLQLIGPGHRTVEASSSSARARARVRGAHALAP